MQNYLDALKNCYENGVDIHDDRTGVGRRKIFGQQLRWDLSKGLPVMTTKKVNLPFVIHELLWLLSGSTNIELLVKNGVPIWTEWPFAAWLKAVGRENEFPRYTDDKMDFSPEWKKEITEFTAKILADPEFAKQWGELGPTYSHQWRNYNATKNDDGSYNLDGKDQIKQAQELLRTNPNSTRIIVDAWNAIEATQVALPPCHMLFQFNSFVDETGERNLVTNMRMRSADAFLGVPFNITSYAILSHMMAQTTGHKAHELIIDFNDFHIYLNQFDAVETQLARTPKALPQIKLNPNVRDILDFKFEDIEVINYEHDPYIKAPVAV